MTGPMMLIAEFHCVRLIDPCHDIGDPLHCGCGATYPDHHGCKPCGAVVQAVVPMAIVMSVGASRHCEMCGQRYLITERGAEPIGEHEEPSHAFLDASGKPYKRKFITYVETSDDLAFGKALTKGVVPEMGGRKTSDGTNYTGKHRKGGTKALPAKDQIQPQDIGARGSREWSRTAKDGGPVTHPNGQSDGTRRG